MDKENSLIAEELSKLKSEFEEFKKQFLDYSAATLKAANKQIEERPFGMLMLPSKGLFYKNKNKSLLIGFITYFEENILTSEMMHEADIAMPIILEKIITNNDFDIKEILACDVQAISMFLRAYSYGNDIEIDVECPHCGKKDKHMVRISNFQSKNFDFTPDEKGEISVISPKFNRNIKIKTRNYFEELEFKKGSEKKNVESIAFYIAELEGERDNEKIKKTLASLKLPEFREIKKTVLDSLPGIDASVTYNCMFCEKDTQISFGHNGADFLKLPATFMNNVLEEIFLLSHYGESISVEAAKKMPVGERRWFINRLSEELEKKKKAEEEAVQKAKSKSRSKR